MKNLKIIPLILIICTSIVFIAGCSMSSQRKMNEYLNKKYAMKFEFVKKPYLNGNEGFGYKYEAKVIPVGKPELEFLVQEYESNTHTYVDSYLQTKWTYEGKQEIEKKIKEVYGLETDFILDYTFRYNKEEFKDLSYLEVFEKSNGKAYINVSYYIFCDKLDKYEEAEKAYKILKPYLIDNKVNIYDFNVIFERKEFKQEFVANGNTSGKKSYDELHKEGVLKNFLKVYYIKDSHPVDVNNSTDLIKYFRY